MRIAALIPVLTLVAVFTTVTVPHAQVLARDEKAPEANPGEQSPASLSPSIPPDDQIATLIVSTIVALNQANFTGNYSVFRELASPNFQAANGSARLSEIFAELRKKAFDLSPIILLQPKLLREPDVDAQGRLRVTGFFVTTPEQLNFDLLYEAVDGRWRLFGIAANTTPAQGRAPGTLGDTSRN